MMYGEITPHVFLVSKASHMQDFEIFQINAEYRNLLHTPYLYAPCIACKLYIISYLPGTERAAQPEGPIDIVVENGRKVSTKF